MQNMLISFAFCVLLCSTSRVLAWPWGLIFIQPSPSLQPTTAVQSTPLIQARYRLSRGRCNYGRVSCRNGYQCIRQSWVCDNYRDCYDGSDEIGCKSSQDYHVVTASVVYASPTQVAVSQSACPYWQFTCNNGQCVAAYSVCNGWYDCSDGSDEWFWNCRYSSSIKPSSTVNVQASQIVCQYWQFRCYNGRQCVNQYNLCDGWRHCSDGSDEWSWNCIVAGYSSINPSSTSSVQASQSVCQYWQFRCSNGRECVNQYNRCDGWRHCSDGSDEWSWNCRTTRTPTWRPTWNYYTTSRYCFSWEFRCRNGQCIPQWYKCNGTNECSDDSDEDWVTCALIYKKANKSLNICQNKLDLGFILDSSGSVGYDNFQKMKSFVKDLIDYYKLAPKETRVSVMSFSSSANIHIPFSETFVDKTYFNNAVDRIRFDGGDTATAMALNMAYINMFTTRNGARGTEFKKVLIILTDGQSNTGQVSGPARQLKSSGVIIFSVGIGSGLSMHELREMASDPIDQHVLSLANFTQLSSLAERMSSQTCNASRFQVFCDNDYMTAVFSRNDLPKHVDVDRLYLRDGRCKAQWNSTHVLVRTSLTGCGTLYSKNDQTLFFDNVLSEQEYYHDNSGITRKYLFGANLTCTYPRKRTVGSFSFEPAKKRLFVSLSGQGNFSLTMEVFKDSSFRNPYSSQDYPVFKSLSDNLYIQYSINTSNSDLAIRAETCRATPTSRQYDSPQYIFIKDGCDKDETIRHYTFGMNRVQRFSIQAFRLLSQHRFVYLHCDLVVCNRFDYNSTCARSTSCPRRARRDVDGRSGSKDVSGIYPLSFGPVMETKESARDKSSDARVKVNLTTLVGSMAGFGCLSLVLFGALLYTIHRYRRPGNNHPQLRTENKS